MLALASLIMYGWPGDKTQTLSMSEYWPYRDGIIYRVLIPTAMRPRLLQQIHSGHLGAERCTRAARDSLANDPE